jgi:hypothetical protein
MPYLFSKEKIVYFRNDIVYSSFSMEKYAFSLESLFIYEMLKETYIW